MSADKFTFSIEQAETTEKDMDLRISALEHRINTLSKRVEIKGLPVVDMILGLTSDKDELQLLGKVIERVAEPIQELEVLKRRKAVLETAKSDTNWMIAALGDFSEQVESLEPDKF